MFLERNGRFLAEQANPLANPCIEDCNVASQHGVSPHTPILEISKYCGFEITALTLSESEAHN
jgi:hypothetical protein